MDEFSEEKKQKSTAPGQVAPSPPETDKSFLVLFFKKELPF
jgi:hypothetical protein